MISMEEQKLHDFLKVSIFSAESNHTETITTN
nr:MAG TPA: hypothetical protein [Bacteriophage sp.]